MTNSIPARLAACLCATLIAATARADAPPPAVSYIVAAKQPVYAAQTYTGRIQSPQIVQIQARVTGFLEQQNFKDGDKITKGELLYVIEQPPYQAAVDQAAAAVATAQAQARNAQLTLTRDEALLHTAAGQQSTVDAAQAAYLSDQAAILSAQAQLHMAQINLGYTEIHAPFDGVIGATTVTPGNVVGPTSGVLATIVSEDPMYVSFALPAVDALKLRPEASQLDLIVQLPNGQTYAPTGKIDFFNNQVTANTDTVNWRGTIANPSHELTDGEFVNVVLRTQAAKDQVVIPLAAVITDQLGDYVLEVGPGNKVVRHTVKLGQQTDTSVPVLSGVAEGDKIITDGLQKIHPGIVVNPQAAGQG